MDLGGKGANQAVAAARLGSAVTLVGAVGDDGFGKDAIRILEAEDVHLSLEVFDTATGMAFIDVGPDSGNIIRLAEGANGSLTESSVAMRVQSMKDGDVVLLQNEIPVAASIAVARIARSAGGLVIMDPAPAPVPFWHPNIFENFDIITPNAHETQMILGQLPGTLDDAQHAARRLALSVQRGAIVTMGQRGVAWCIDGASGQMRAPDVITVDTVAAGDCFNGAFASSCAAGHPIALAIRNAQEAAAFATTVRGAADSTPTREQLEKFRQDLYSMTTAH